MLFAPLSPHKISVLLYIPSCLGDEDISPMDIIGLPVISTIPMGTFTAEEYSLLLSMEYSSALRRGGEFFARNSRAEQIVDRDGKD